MAKFLDGTGLSDLITKIKNAFVAKADTTAVTGVDVDSTPTASSTNLVTSGGVYQALQGAGTVQDVTVGGTSVVANKVAVIPEIPEAIDTVNVSVDNNTGTPSASGSVSGSTLSLAFSNLKGANGANGANGVGISSVTQTTESTESGGTNVITVAKTDGTSSTFKVRNGNAVGTVPVVQTTGNSTTSAMSQDAVTRELENSETKVVKVSPNSVFTRLNISGFLYSSRIVSFAEIKNATSIVRTLLHKSFMSVNFYSMGSVLGFYQSSNTYLVANIADYKLQIRQYVNGVALHNEDLGNINALGVNNYGDIAVSFDNKNKIFTFYGYDVNGGNIVLLTQCNISDWDLSSLTDVYLATSVSSYGTTVCNTTVVLNSPLLLHKYIAVPLRFGYYNTPSGNNPNDDIVLEGTGLTVGGTVISTISATDKIVSISNSSAVYFGIGPSNINDNYGWHHETLVFSSVDTGAYFSVGVQYKRIIVECDGLPIWDTLDNDSSKFYPEAGKTYELYYQYGVGQTQSYQNSYGIRAYGNMTVEILNPYFFNPQVQNICAETYDGVKFTGAIPFAGNVSFIDYEVTGYSIAKLRTPLFATYVDANGHIMMWNGEVWKRINNS